jgi:hypothetical protein
MRYALARRICLTLLLGASLAASTVGGQTAVASLSGSTRSAGLGGAGVALVGDAGAIFSNPAGIATVRHIAVEGSYEPYLGGATLTSGAFAIRLPRFDLGAGVQALDYGTEAEIVPDPATGGRTGMPTGNTFRSTDLLGVGTIVYRAGMIAVGVSGKYVRQQIGSWSANGWAGDGGLTIAVFDILAFGVSVQNIGGAVSNGAVLPHRTRAGFTMNYVDPQGTYRLLTTLEGQWLVGAKPAFVAGVEGGVVTRGVGLVARLGYAAARPANDASPLSFGAGVELGRLHFDYAYQNYDVLGGGLSRIGVRWTP